MSRRGCQLGAMIGALVVAGCEGDTIARRPSSGFFEPEFVDFGEVPAGRTHVGTTTLRNTSGSAIVVRSVRFEPALDVYGAFLEAGGTLNGASLPNGRAVEVEIRFGPRTEGQFNASMVIEADDLAIGLPIRARARQETPAAPALSPGAIAFSGIPVGQASLREIELTNAGDRSGRLDSILVPSGPFSVENRQGAPVALPIFLDPGQSTRMQIRYQPLQPETEARAQIVFGFSAVGTRAVLELSGRSTNIGQLSCPQVPVDFGAIPRGRTETQTIRCARPGNWTFESARWRSGSAPYFVMPSTPRTTPGALEVDVSFEALGSLGQHLGLLELQGAEGAVSAVTVTGTIASPVRGEVDIGVELTWNTPFSDFDLHLVREGGLPFVDGEDCYFQSKNPAWGDAARLTDDPFLDRDDREGYGPETLTLLEAREGRFDLYVQYHDFTRGRVEATTVTIDWRLRSDGGRRHIDMLECGGWWHVGTFINGPPLRFEPVDRLSTDFRSKAAERCR